MKKSIFIICILILSFSGCLQQFNSDQLEEYQIHIPGKGGFHSLHEAITQALPGETIILSKGIYYEPIFINKSIHINGKNQHQTIIDGMGNSTICEITADNVKISNLTIRNSSNGFYDAGIKIEANNTTITNNIIYDTIYAIYITKNTKENKVFNNTLFQNQHGVYLRESTENIISNNFMYQHKGFGIYIDFYANNNQINYNSIYSNEVGLRVKTAVHNVITKNWIMNNADKGIYVCCSAHNNRFFQNYFINNTINAVDTYSNYWSYNHMGNYWDDYTTKNQEAIDENNDGIWDEPYLISNGKNKDDHPLIEFPKPPQN